MTSLAEDQFQTTKKKKKGKLKWLFRDAFFSTLLSLVCFSAISSLIFSTSYFNPLLHGVKDFSFLDAYYQANFSQKGQIDSNLVLINIGNFERREIAQLLDTLGAHDPEVIGVDIIFEETENSAAEIELRQSLARNKAIGSYIYMIEDSAPENHVAPAGMKRGYVNLTANDATGVIRGFEGMIADRNGMSFAFAGQLVRQFKNGAFWLEHRLDQKLKKQRRIKYYGHYSYFESYDAQEVLSSDFTESFKGKLVLVGYAGYPTGDPFDVEDKHFTPLNTNPLGKGIPDMYGLTIHANITNMLLKGDFFWELGIWGQALLIFLCAYLASLYFIWLDRRLKISYRTVRKFVLFVFAMFLVGCCLWAFGKNIAVEPTLVVIITIFSAGFVKYYKHLVRYIKTKRKFKSYIR